jgi:hypothetical protein
VLSESHTIEARKELEEIRNNINEVTDAFYAQLKKFRSGAAYQAINEGYGFRDKIRELLQLKNKHFESHANKIIEIYKETLALPEMFAELVMPNSTRTLKPIAEDNGASTGTNMELPKRDEVFDYLQNLKVKDIYFMAKNMLAPFAVDNTFMQLLQYSGIDIQRAYNRISAKGKKMERYVHNLLLTIQNWIK